MQSSQPTKSLPFPSLRFALAVILFLVAARCHGWAPGGQWYWEPAAIACAVTGIFQVVAALSQWDEVRDAKRHKKEFQRFGKSHGSASRGTLLDVKRFGLNAKRGIICGMLNGVLLRSAGDGCGHVFGARGAGKGTGFVVPFLIDEPGYGDPDWIGSVIIPDPKGDLYAMTADAQREMGREVVAMNAYREKFIRELGFDIPDVGGNLLRYLDPNDPELKDEADLFASLIAPGSAPERMSAHERFFLEEAQGLISGTMLDEVTTYGSVNIPTVRDRLMLSGDEMVKSLAKMATNTSLSGVVAQYGHKYAGMMVDSPEQWQGVLATALRALSIYDAFGPIGQSISRDGFDLRRLKETPTALYILLPTDRGITHAPYMNLVLSIAMELNGRIRNSRRVTLLADECANLGYLSGLLRWVSLYRSQGSQVVATWQSSSQMTRLYGRDGAKELLAQSDFSIFMELREYEDLKLVSDLMGQTTIADGSQNLRPGQDGSLQLSYSGNFRGRPLMQPSELRCLSADKQVLLFKNAPPFIVDKLDYRTHPVWKKRAKPNPYYRKGSA